MCMNYAPHNQRQPDLFLPVPTNFGGLRGASHQELRADCGAPQKRGDQVALVPYGDSTSLLRSSFYDSRFAASAASASRVSVVKNCFGWPAKRFMLVRNAAAALAPPNLSVNGRMMAQ